MTRKCATCHDAHRRQPRSASAVQLTSRSPGRFKFLRTMSAQFLCNECHGPDALFRYLYFHDPAKRKGGLKRSIIVRQQK